MGRSGAYQQQMSGELAYRAFIPSALPPQPSLALDEEMVAQLVQAHAQLSRLEALSGQIPDVGQFIHMYVRKEALMSSQIEGTQATLEDVLDPEKLENADRHVTDVVNYVRATEFAIARMQELPLCNRLLRETHAVLMEGVRGQEKSPGAFRHSQNWIGAAGSTLQNALFVPPPPEAVEPLMSGLEKYMHEADGLDVLVRAALIHSQFETIHPFLDGNGRVGRLLITLYLMARGLLSTPALYVSYFLKKNRVEYYDRMMALRLQGHYEQWVSFFLRALTESAADAVESIAALSALHAQDLARVRTLGRAARSAEAVYRHLLAHPIIQVQGTATALKLSFNTVSAAVTRLEGLGILSPLTDQERNRRFAYTAYLDILKRGT